MSVALVALSFCESAWAHAPEDVPAPPSFRDWSWDPIVLAALGLMLGVYVRGARALWRRAGTARGIGVWEAAAFGAGLLVLVVALLSPLDRASGLLFSAHMTQHLLLTTAAAPLVVLGRPAVALAWGAPSLLVRYWQRAVRLRRALRAMLHPVAVLVTYVGMTWLWHAPALYELALQSRSVHLLEHASFWLSSVAFWWVVLGVDGARGKQAGTAVLLVFASAVQGGVLGALITIAPTSWYAGHELGALAFAMTALEDQQLAGLLMWVPGSLVYLAAGLLLMRRWLLSGESLAQRRERALERSARTVSMEKSQYEA